MKTTSDDARKSSNQQDNKAISGTTLSSWSCQQKWATIAGFAILGMFLAVSACSKQSPKPALISVSNPAPISAMPAPASTVAAIPMASAASTPIKTIQRKRSANVTFSDANSGVSFLYPRKFSVISGDNALSDPATAGSESMNMNFARPGGVAVATVEVPGDSYPGTDFASAFFGVNVNRNLSEQECGHFAFVDTGNADGEPVDAEKVKIGSSDMETTSDFSASAMRQEERQFYHTYENGTCYEYVLGLGTAGYGAHNGMEHINPDVVFAKLQKILTTVKVKANVNPVVQEHVAETGGSGVTNGKE